MAEETRHWTQADIENMRDQVAELNTRICEAEAYIAMEKVGYLEDHFKRELTGKVIMSEHPWNDGDSMYMYITFVKVELDWSGKRSLRIGGVSLRVKQDNIGDDSGRSASIGIDLDDDGHPLRVLFGTESEPDDNVSYSYRVVDPEELAKPKGIVRKQIEHALELRNAAHAELGKKAVEKFLREFRGKRKEIETATQETPGKHQKDTREDADSTGTVSIP